MAPREVRHFHLSSQAIFGSPGRASSSFRVESSRRCHRFPATIRNLAIGRLVQRFGKRGARFPNFFVPNNKLRISLSVNTFPNFKGKGFGVQKTGERDWTGRRRRRRGSDLQDVIYAMTMHAVDLRAVHVMLVSGSNSCDIFILIYYVLSTAVQWTAPVVKMVIW